MEFIGKHKERLAEILKQCDDSYIATEKYVDGKKKGEKNSYHIRNEYMVDRSRYLLAVWNGRGGGTGTTIKYAQSKRREIIHINPNDFMEQVEA